MWADEEARKRVCLDLNVFVAAEIAQLQGMRDTTPLRLLDCARRGRFDLVISRAMLDRLALVLCRQPLSFDPIVATERVELLAELSALANLLVVGTGVLPVPDAEDRAVLEAALAGGAHLLATYNLKDFRPLADSPGSGEIRIRGLSVLHPTSVAARVGC